jgi:hypothetical protein
MGNQTLGRGKLHFSLFKAGTQEPAGFRYLGNSPSFSLNIENETLDHFNSDEGIREKDKSIVLQTNATGSLVLDDIQPENLALFFFGSASAVTQTSATSQSETITGVKKGHGYQIGRTTQNPTGVRSLSNVVIAVGSSTKTLGTDYTLDAELGILTIGTGGTIAEDATVTVTYDRAARTRKQVISGTTQVEGALRYIATNPEGDKLDYYMGSVRLSPNGDFELKGDEWQQLPLSVEILKPTSGERILIDGRPYAV